jgi:hypothetical protein
MWVGHSCPTPLTLPLILLILILIFTLLLTLTGKGTALDVAEKLDLDLAFGWRSGLPLR